MKNDIYYSHQTPVELAKLLIEKIDLKDGDVVLEPFKGEGAFYDNFPTNVEKEWTEVEEGRDYTSHKGKIDWVITNPPYRLETGVKRINSFWLILNHYADKVDKGMAFLTNDKCFGTLTPNRIKILNDKGLYLKKMITCSIKRWRGRYFFIIFTREKCDFHETLLGTF
jgi:hypothetical protein